MPVEVAIWNVTDNGVKRIKYSSISSEKKLEDVLSADICILSDSYFAMGRQVQTYFGKSIDLLAIDIEGNLSVIELKKNKTPRDVVAQALDYPKLSDFLRRYLLRSCCSKVRENRRHTRRSVEDFRGPLMRNRFVQIE